MPKFCLRENPRCRIRWIFILIIFTLIYIVILIVIHDMLYLIYMRRHEVKSNDVLNRTNSVKQISNQFSLSTSVPHQMNFSSMFYIKNVSSSPKDSRTSISERCHMTIPTIIQIDYNNIYWQRFLTSNGTYFLYNAYYDDRESNKRLPLIRIISLIDRYSPPPILCQLWFENIIDPVITLASYSYGWHKKWGSATDGIFQPFLISCPISRTNDSIVENIVPKSVSLVEKLCINSTNNIPIISNRPQSAKQDFAVCVKGLDFLNVDNSLRVIEWIELLRILGANKIFFYEFKIHPNLSKVLDYYRNQDLVHVKQVTLPGSWPNLPDLRHKFLQENLTVKRRNEIIAYNDCLYKNLYMYKYIIALDIDEVIIPLIHKNWPQLLSNLPKSTLNEPQTIYDAYEAQSVYFFDDINIKGTDNSSINDNVEIPAYQHMLKYVYRSKQYMKKGAYLKSFFDTERVIVIHNHYTLICVNKCHKYRMNTSVSHVQHYRQDCVKELSQLCKTEYRKNMVRDTTIWKYKDELIERTKKVIAQLGFGFVEN